MFTENSNSNSGSSSSSNTDGRKGLLRRLSLSIPIRRTSSPDVSLLIGETTTATATATTDSDSLSDVSSSKSRKHANSMPQLPRPVTQSPARSGDESSVEKAARKKERKHASKTHKHRNGGEDDSASPEMGASRSEGHVSNTQLYEMLTRVSGDIERVSTRIDQYYRDSGGGGGRPAPPTAVTTTIGHAFDTTEINFSLDSESEDAGPFEFLYRLCPWCCCCCG